MAAARVLSLPLTRPGKETAAGHPLRASPRAVLHCICSRKARGGQGSMPSTPALPSLFLPRVTSRRVAGAPPPLILGRESSHLRRIVATRTVRVVCGAHLPLCVRDHQRRPYRDALTALDNTSTWPTTQVSLSDASRRLRVLLVEAPLHAYLVGYSLHHVSTSLTMIADSSCDRIGLFESYHTMHKV